MTIVYLLLLLALHYLTGSGLLQLFKLELTSAKRIAVSFLTGIVIASFVPFLLQLAFIPITFSSVCTSIIAVCSIMNIARINELKKENLKALSRNILPHFRIYEWPFMILFTIMLLASVWRSFYLPVVARDMLSGPEVIAEYTIREHTMINSVFSVNLETTNNHHKPPYIVGLQIIYKLAGLTFGQLWVSLVAIAFTVFLFQVLRERVHGIIACTMLLMFFAIPELYAYTYVMLFDYSNMVFFFLAVYFLQVYFQNLQTRNIYFAALLFAFATFIRLETLVFTAMMLPMLWFHAYRQKNTRKVFFPSILIVVLPFAIYFLWVNVYLKYYMPAQFHLNQQINSNLSDLTPLFTRFEEMNTKLFFGKYSRPLWGYFILAFLAITVADLLMFRKVKKESATWYYAVAVIYFGLPLLGYLLPLIDLLNTTKRGLFKMFPLLLLLIANTTILQRLSHAITNWEMAPEPRKMVKTVSKRAVRRR